MTSSSNIGSSCFTYYFLNFESFSAVMSWNFLPPSFLFVSDRKCLQRLNHNWHIFALISKNIFHSTCPLEIFSHYLKFVGPKFFNLSFKEENVLIKVSHLSSGEFMNIYEQWYVVVKELIPASDCILAGISTFTTTVTFHSRSAPFVTCRLELNYILQNFLSELSLFNPSFAILHIPQLFDEKRKVDIAKIFPVHTVVVKCMESLFGANENLSHIELQALLFSAHMRQVYT